MRNHLSQHCGNLVDLNALSMTNMPGFLGIRISAVGADFICAEMPVSNASRQPFGLLHGGASATLAESLGSMGSYVLVQNQPDTAVAGIEINCSHIRAVTGDLVTAVCRPLRITRNLHFWQIDISDESGNLCCASRLTVSILRKSSSQAAS